MVVSASNLFTEDINLQIIGKIGFSFAADVLQKLDVVVIVVVFEFEVQFFAVEVHLRITLESSSVIQQRWKRIYSYLDGFGSHLTAEVELYFVLRTVLLLGFHILINIKCEKCNK